MSRKRQYGYDYKLFSDLLGPLQKYLRSQVGRPWDKVYSELSASLDKRSITGIHIWTHVFQEVELHCILRGRIVFRQARGRYYDERPVAGLFVHPRHGLLCWKPIKRFRHVPRVNPDERVLDSLRTLVREKGIWYLRTFRIDVSDETTYGPCRLCPRKQLGFSTSILMHERTFAHVWKGETFIRKVEVRRLAAKHQLSRRELTEYSIVNAPIDVRPFPRRASRRLQKGILA
jgi:hypothetical protein